MQRRQRPEDAGAADENVELAPALVERWTELVDFVAPADVEFDERRLAAESADLVVELFEPADGARGDDDVRALPGKLERHGTADAAGSAGHQRQAIFERFLILHAWFGRWRQPSQRLLAAAHARGKPRR